jgi:hypothetical protein
MKQSDENKCGTQSPNMNVLFFLTFCLLLAVSPLAVSPLADGKLSKARLIEKIIDEIKKDGAKFESLRSSGFFDTRNEPALNPKI